MSSILIFRSSVNKIKIVPLFEILLICDTLRQLSKHPEPKTRMKTLHKFLKKAKKEVKADQDLILLTTLSAVLASYGIRMNNVFVLIGAMLVSPIFDPIISVVILAKSKEKNEFGKAAFSLIATISLAYITSILFWYMELFLGNLQQYSADVIINWDVLIVAVLIGFVGVLLWIWPKSSNTSAGVAIAISLVPPIANIALSTVLGDIDQMLGHLALFTINIIGIIIGANIGLYLYRHDDINEDV